MPRNCPVKDLFIHSFVLKITKLLLFRIFYESDVIFTLIFSNLSGYQRFQSTLSFIRREDGRHQHFKVNHLMFYFGSVSKESKCIPSTPSLEVEIVLRFQIADCSGSYIFYFVSILSRWPCAWAEEAY